MKAVSEIMDLSSKESRELILEAGYRIRMEVFSDNLLILEVGCRIRMVAVRLNRASPSRLGALTSFGRFCAYNSFRVRCADYGICLFGPDCQSGGIRIDQGARLLLAGMKPGGNLSREVKTFTHPILGGTPS